MKDLTPEGSTRTPKCASAPSQSVYSAAFGFAAATADAFAQHLDHASLRDLALQPCQKLAPGRPVLIQSKGLGRLGLGCAEEGGKLSAIDAVFAVIVAIAAAAPACTAVAGRRFAVGRHFGRVAWVARQRGGNQAFEALFGGVCRHVTQPGWALL